MQVIFAGTESIKTGSLRSNGCNSTELGRGRRITSGCGTCLAYVRPRGRLTDCLLRSLPVLLDEILERFSSSSLPPSFALGRCVAFFMTRGTARSGTPFLLAREG